MLSTSTLKRAPEKKNSFSFQKHTEKKPTSNWQNAFQNEPELVRLGELQALPKDAKPITLWTNQDTAFADVAEGIANLVAELPQKKNVAVLSNAHA